MIPLARVSELTPGLAILAPSATGSEALRAGLLDLHEGICDVGYQNWQQETLRDPRVACGCARWPEALRLLNLMTGELVLGRCKATNLCPYCRMLYTIETVEMLLLDAMEWAPTIYAVLTAREHLTRRDTYSHLRQLRRACQRRWPEIEWATSVEFQKKGRLHLNLPIKGVPVEDVDELRGVMVERWCSRVDALPVGQWVEPIEDGIGVVKYISGKLAHGLKVEQAPPIGWKGHRTSQTRGYLVRPASVMRLEARRSVNLRRALHRGESLEMAESSADRGDEWKLVAVHPTGGPDQARLMREDARRPFELAKVRAS
jgi:hypothetical protein